MLPSGSLQEVRFISPDSSVHSFIQTHSVIFHLVTYQKIIEWKRRPFLRKQGIVHDSTLKSVYIFQVFPPAFRDLKPPALELFDLDEAFSSEKARLAQLTNKCSDEDLEYYIRECGDILAVSNKLPQTARSAKNILEYVFTQIVEFKKLNQVKKNQIVLNVLWRQEINFFQAKKQISAEPTLRKFLSYQS